MAANTQSPNVVLVHGAWADGSSWSRIIPLLHARGLNVTAVQNPLTSLEADVATTKRAIARQDGLVLLVGHSYGGAVISEAGNDPKVVGLVYVAAFAPDAGQSVGDLGKDFPPPPGAAELRQDVEGFLTLTAKGVEEHFAADVPEPDRKTLTATQGPTNAAALGGRIGAAAWKEKRTWYVVAEQDHMIDPGLQRVFAASMKARTLPVPSSHVPMLSHPAEVAGLIIEAARSVAK